MARRSDAETSLRQSARPRRVLDAISQDHVVRAYRRYAPYYDRLFGAVLDPGRRALAGAVEALSPTSVLEVGVGTGLMLPSYPRSARVVGVDISPDMLTRAQERIDGTAHPNVRLALMDAEYLAFADGSFDCVTLPYVLSVTPRPQQLIAEVRRVCRRGGTILILNHFSGSGWWWPLERLVRPLAGRIGFRSDFRLASEVSRHDWDVEWVRDVNVLGLSKLVSIRNVARDGRCC
jgi:phosphatidylethanolamine/phosphatidyl-N-methylethanolamine N-methyltransferase